MNARPASVSPVKMGNDVVRFALELAALASFAVIGWSLAPGALRWAAVVVVPVCAAAVWGRWMAPRSPRQLRDPLRLVVEVLFFLAAFGGLIAVGHAVAGGVLVGVACVNLPLDRLLDRPAPQP